MDIEERSEKRRRVEDTDATSVVAQAAPQRPSLAAAVSDVAFSRIETTLMDLDLPVWNCQQRRLLIALVSDFVNRCTEQYGRETDTACEQAGTAVAAAEAQPAVGEAPGGEARALAPAEVDDLPDEFVKDDIAVLWSRLAKVRSVLAPLTPFGSIPEVTTAPYASSLFPTTDAPTYAVDSFLYENDDDVEALCEVGLVKRDYCLACKGVEIAPTRFISHSFSAHQLAYIFAALLPHALGLGGSSSSCPSVAAATATGATVPRRVKLVDVGSRLGIVLFAACQASPVYNPVVGIEINPRFVALQNKAIARLKLSPQRVVVHEMDALSDAGLAEIASADVVFLNNVFEWFLPQEEQLAAWRKVMAALSRPGQLLVTYPSLRESLAPLLGLEQLNAEGKPVPTTEKGRAAVQRRANDAADALVAGWVERVQTDRLIDTFMKMSHLNADENCCGKENCEHNHDDTGSNASIAEEQREALQAMCCYRVILAKPQ